MLFPYDLGVHLLAKESPDPEATLESLAMLVKGRDLSSVRAGWLRWDEGPPVVLRYVQSWLVKRGRGSLSRFERCPMPSGLLRTQQLRFD